MSTLTIQLPDSVYRKISEFVSDAGTTVDQFVASAASEKLSAVLGLDHLRQESEKAPSCDEIRGILAKVPKDGPVEEGD